MFGIYIRFLGCKLNYPTTSTGNPAYVDSLPSAVERPGGEAHNLNHDAEAHG